jgi:hypothetical protein
MDKDHSPSASFMADGITRLVDALGDIHFTFAVNGHRYLVSVVEALILRRAFFPSLTTTARRMRLKSMILASTIGISVIFYDLFGVKLFRSLFHLGNR